MLSTSYSLTFFCAVLFALIAFLMPKREYDIQWHDTYFIFSNSILPAFIVGIFIIQGICYWIVERFINECSFVLTIIHIALLFASILLLIIWFSFSFSIQNEGLKFYGYHSYRSDLIDLYLPIAFITCFLFGILLFVVNLIIGLMKLSRVG